MAKKASAPPSRQKTAQNDNRTPFLKVDNLPKKKGPNTLMLTGWVRELNGQYGPQIGIEVTTEDGGTFDYTIKKGSESHRMLFKLLGRDHYAWKGSISVEAVEGSRGGHFINVIGADPDAIPF